MQPGDNVIYSTAQHFSSNLYANQSQSQTSAVSGGAAAALPQVPDMQKAYIAFDEPKEVKTIKLTPDLMAEFRNWSEQNEISTVILGQGPTVATGYQTQPTSSQIQPTTSGSQLSNAPAGGSGTASGNQQPQATAGQPIPTPNPQPPQPAGNNPRYVKICTNMCIEVNYTATKVHKPICKNLLLQLQSSSWCSRWIRSNKGRR